MSKSYITSLAFFLILLISNSGHAQVSSDSNKIKYIIQEEVVAWNTGDAELYSKHFAKDGTFTNILGMFFIGRLEFKSKHDQVFKTVFKGTKLTQRIVSLKFIKPNVAIIETLCDLSEFSKNGPPKGSYLNDKGHLLTRLLQVLTRVGANWKIVAYHNVDLKPGVFVPE